MTWAERHGWPEGSIRDEWNASGPKPGDQVAIRGGRHHGAKGKLVEFVSVAGPSGSAYRFAIVKRPRAGVTVVFEHEIGPVE